jgi:hypothetical protein
MLVSPDISKDDLLEIIVHRVVDQNPDDTRIVAGQTMIHPGLNLELKRLVGRLERLSAEELRVILIRGKFDFCTE